ncbi:hypothetical protein NDU88_008276, partial [Pleurodeles waltl]
QAFYDAVLKSSSRSFTDAPPPEAKYLQHLCSGLLLKHWQRLRVVLPSYSCRPSGGSLLPYIGIL